MTKNSNLSSEFLYAKDVKRITKLALEIVWIIWNINRERKENYNTTLWIR